MKSYQQVSMTSTEATAYLLEVRHHLHGMIDQKSANIDLIQLARLADDRIAELARYMIDSSKLASSPRPT